MRFLILTTVFLLSHTVLANNPRRPFPHGQEDHAPADEEASNKSLWTPKTFPLSPSGHAPWISSFGSSDRRHPIPPYPSG